MATLFSLSYILKTNVTLKLNLDSLEKLHLQIRTKTTEWGKI